MPPHPPTGHRPLPTSSPSSLPPHHNPTPILIESQPNLNQLEIVNGLQLGSTLVDNSASIASSALESDQGSGSGSGSDYSAELIPALFATSTLLSGQLDGASQFVQDIKSEDAIRVAVVYGVLCVLWLLNFLRLVGWTAMSGAFCLWYFFQHPGEAAARSHFPILGSLRRVVRYHLGTVAFASLVVAIVQLIQLVMEAFIRKTRKLQDNNQLLKLVISCSRLVLECFKKTVEFISECGLVYTALEGSSFCYSCYETFKLIGLNPIQMAFQVAVSRLLQMLAVVVIPLSCALVTFDHVNTAIEPPLNQPLYPAIAVFLTAFLSARQADSNRQSACLRGKSA